MLKYFKYLLRSIGLKTVYQLSQDVFLTWRGLKPLTVDQTIALMSGSEVKAIPGSKTPIQAVKNCGVETIKIFPEKEAKTDPVYVWDYEAAGGKNISLSRYGTVILDGKALCTDWSQRSLYQEIWKSDDRTINNLPRFIALFSQFQDGIFYGGYYDFVFLVAIKLARIRSAFPGEDLSKIPISYPLFQTSYEQEYLQLLGFDPIHLVDSVKYKVVSQRVITGNSAHWYPNPADITGFRQLIEQQFKPVKTASNRIYISRKGRRVINNEDELITMLKQFDFEIIEDKPRSVTEQISIYHNAGFILGPHGASFSNIIWCEPGTHLFELFSPNYKPDFFQYISTVMGLQYAAYYHGSPDPSVNYLDGLVEDICVSILELEACLQAIFKDNKFTSFSSSDFPASLQD